MSDRRFKVSINPNIIGKPDRTNPINQAVGWSPRELTIDELISEITFGRAFSAWFKDAYRKSENFLVSDMVAVDIDGGLAINDALSSPFITSNASFMYTTPSHRPEAHRFRIVFLTERPITSKDEWKHALLGAGRKLGGDPAVGDAARQFYGSPNAEVHRFGNILPNAELDALIETGKIARKQQLRAIPGFAASARAVSPGSLSRIVRTARGLTCDVGDLPKSTSVFCPVHEDRNPSAFTVRSRNGSIGVHCAACATTYWYESPADYDFDEFERLIEKRKAIPARQEPKTDRATLSKWLPPIEKIDVKVLSEKYLPPITYRPGITCVKSPKGSGKTKALEALVAAVKTGALPHGLPKKEYPRSILLIGHRQTLLREAASKLGLECYLDQPEPSSYYAICLDSLPSRLRHSPTYDLIILDESEQVFRHLLSDTIDKGPKLSHCWSKLEFLLRRAKAVVALDADLGFLTAHGLRYLRKDDWEERFFLIYNRHTVSSTGSKQILLYENYNQLVDELIDDVRNGKRCFVTGNSRSRILKLADTLQIKADPCGPLVTITSDNSRDEAIIEFVKNIKTSILDCQVLLASPSLGTGVDITFPNDRPEIDCVYGFFETLITTHMDADQQIARVRHPKQIKVWLGTNSPDFETDFDVLMDQIATSFTIPEAVKRTDDDGKVIYDPEHPLLQIYTHVLTSERSSKRNFRRNFLSLKRKQGVDVIPVDRNPEAAKRGKKAYALGSSIRMQKRIDGLMSATVLDDESFKELHERRRKNGSLTIDEKLALERAEIERSFNVEITPQLIEANDGGKLQEKVSLLRDVLTVETEPHWRFIKHGHFDDIFSADATKTLPFRMQKRIVLFMLLDQPGLVQNGTLCTTAPISSASLTEQVAFWDRNRTALEEIFKSPLRDDFKTNPIQQLNNFLSSLGLSLVMYKRKMRRGQSTNLYILDPNKTQFMFNLSSDFTSIEKIFSKNF